MSMQINNSKSYQYNIYQPNFTSCSRDVLNSIGGLMHRNDTSLFRADLNCAKFVEYLGEKFKDTDKVNLYCLSSSAGDEVYSVIMKLINVLGENESKKFFPIIASDYDKNIIRLAKDGFLPMYEGDDGIINKHTNGKFAEYFEKLNYKDIPSYVNDMDIDFDFIAKVKPILREKVIFSVADATEKCKTLSPDNSIVLARNFWPYLKDESQRIRFANELYKNLGDNSAVVIGKYDDSDGAFASKNLQDIGFYPHFDMFNIFEKLKSIFSYKQFI